MSNYTSKHSVDKTRSGKSADAKKKKVLIIVIVAVLAVIIAAALIFIFVPGAESGVAGIFGGKPAYVPETQDGTTIISPYYENGHVHYDNDFPEWYTSGLELIPVSQSDTIKGNTRTISYTEVKLTSHGPVYPSSPGHGYNSYSYWVPARK